MGRKAFFQCTPLAYFQMRLRARMGWLFDGGGIILGG